MFTPSTRGRSNSLPLKLSSLHLTPPPSPAASPLPKGEPVGVETPSPSLPPTPPPSPCEEKTASPSPRQ